MAEIQTPQSEKFDKETEISLKLGNGSPLEPEDDLEFFNHAAAKAAKGMEINVTQNSHSPSQEIPVHHKQNKGKKILASAGIAVATVSGAGFAAGPVGDAIDSHFDHVEEQNKKWAEEAEEAERQFEQGVITIDAPEDTQK